MPVALVLVTGSNDVRQSLVRFNSEAKLFHDRAISLRYTEDIKKSSGSGFDRHLGFAPNVPCVERQSEICTGVSPRLISV